MKRRLPHLVIPAPATAALAAERALGAWQGEIRLRLTIRLGWLDRLRALFGRAVRTQTVIYCQHEPGATMAVTPHTSVDPVFPAQPVRLGASHP